MKKKLIELIKEWRCEEWYDTNYDGRVEAFADEILDVIQSDFRARFAEHDDSDRGMMRWMAIWANDPDVCLDCSRWKSRCKCEEK